METVLTGTKPWRRRVRLTRMLLEKAAARKTRGCALGFWSELLTSNPLFFSERMGKKPTPVTGGSHAQHCCERCTESRTRRDRRPLRGSVWRTVTKQAAQSSLSQAPPDTSVHKDCPFDRKRYRQAASSDGAVWYRGTPHVLEQYTPTAHSQPVTEVSYCSLKKTVQYAHQIFKHGTTIFAERGEK